jgi:hypothetical protein
VAAASITINGTARFTGGLDAAAVTVTVNSTGNATVTGNLAPGTALTIDGDVSVSGSLTPPTSTTTIPGNLTLGTALVGTGDLVVSGTVTASGTTATSGTGDITTSGSGKIFVSGSDLSYTTFGNDGVTIATLDTEIALLAGAAGLGKVANTVALDAAFRKAGTIDVSAIGSVTLDNTSATTIKDDAAGTGTAVAFGTGVTASGGSIKGYDKYSKDNDVSGISFGVNGQNLEITTSSASGTGYKYAIYVITGLKLQSVTSGSGIEVTAPDFNVGVKAKQLP